MFDVIMRSRRRLFICCLLLTCRYRLLSVDVTTTVALLTWPTKRHLSVCQVTSGYKRNGHLLSTLAPMSGPSRFRNISPSSQRGKFHQPSTVIPLCRAAAKERVLTQITYTTSISDHFRPFHFLIPSNAKASRNL